MKLATESLKDQPQTEAEFRHAVSTYATELLIKAGAAFAKFKGPQTRGASGQDTPQTISNVVDDSPREAEFERLREELASERATLYPRIAAGQANVIRNASEDSWFKVSLNDVSLWLPRNAMIMLAHCIHGTLDGEIRVFAETHHAAWMRSKLSPCGVFLDVGAAIGQMTIPTALMTDARVFAFEPARRQRALLDQAIVRNGASGVEVVSAAVSDIEGSASFSEYALDETQEMAIAPETSCLADGAWHQTSAEKYDVPVITLDRFCEDGNLFGEPTVVKIDVEGFEVHVLNGAKRYLAATRPWLSIDIHRDPFGEGTTEAKVRAALSGMGYEFENANHVLLCSPV